MKEVQEAAQNVTQSTKTLGGAVISNSTGVKDAVVDVSQSTWSLGGAVIFNGLGIIARFLTTLLGSQEFRLVVLLGLSTKNIVLHLSTNFHIFTLPQQKRYSA